MKKLIALTIVMTGCALPDPEHGVRDTQWLAGPMQSIAVMEVYDGSRRLDAVFLQKVIARELEAKGWPAQVSEPRAAGKPWGDVDAAAAATSRKVDAVVVCEVRKEDLDANGAERRPEEGVYTTAADDRRTYYMGSEAYRRPGSVRVTIRVVRPDGRVVYEASYKTEVSGSPEGTIAQVLTKPLAKRK